jgi:quercetin dioxygenase-like cupin family protein
MEELTSSNSLTSQINTKKKFYGPHHPLLLNDNVIVFETILVPGQILPMHSHPKPHLRYCFF